MKEPNFLYIGGSRTASKWLHKILLPYFFDKYYYKGWEFYMALFKRVAGEMAIGELSHDYLYSREAAERIKKHLPGVKLIVCIRNPIDRTCSDYCFNLMTGRLAPPFDNAVRLQPKIVEHSYYLDYLKYYFSLFGRENIKVLKYDHLCEDPKGYVRSITDFLGVPFIEGLDYETKFNTRSTNRSVFLGKLSGHVASLLRKYGLVEILGILKRNKLLFNILYRELDSKDKLISDSMKTELRIIYKDEIHNLEKFLGWDLAEWMR
jgi:hypothetical protein